MHEPKLDESKIDFRNPYPAKYEWEKKIFALDKWPEYCRALFNGDKVSVVFQRAKDDPQIVEIYSQSFAKLCFYRIAKKLKIVKSVYEVPSGIQLARLSLEDNVAPEEILQILVAIQTERILVLSKKEMESGKTDRDLTKNIQLLSEIAIKIAEVEDSRLSANRYRQPDTNKDDPFRQQVILADQFKSRFGETKTKVLLDDQSRRRVLDAIEKVRAGTNGPIRDLIDSRIARPKDVN